MLEILKNINFAPAIAALRHVGSYAAGMVTMLMFVGLSADDAQRLVDAIVSLSKGFSEILTALGVIIPALLAVWAAKSSTTKAKMDAVDKIPGVDVKVDTDVAPAGAVAAALDKNNNNVNPLNPV